MKKLSIAVSTVFVVGFAVFNITGAVSATPDREKVDICHATSSESNPFVSLSVAEDSVDGNGGNDNGQGDHYLNHPNDIIPPISGIHSGLNWDEEGQAIWGNGCKPVHPTTTTTTAVPTTTSTSTSTTVPDTTTSTTTTTVPVTSTTSSVPRTTTTTTTTTVPPTTVATVIIDPQTEERFVDQPISFTG